MRRTLVAGVSLVAVAPAHAALAQPVSAPAAPAIALVLPAPTGHQHLGTVSLHLVDRSRPEPWVATQPVRQQ